MNRITLTRIVIFGLGLSLFLGPTQSGANFPFSSCARAVQRFMNPPPNEFTEAAFERELRMQSALQDRYPDFDISQLELKRDRSRPYFGSIYDLDYKNREMARTLFGQFPDSTHTLDFHIEVQPAYQRAGVLPYMLATALKVHPNTERIPNMLGITNLKLFLDSTFGHPDFLRRLKPHDFTHLTPAQIQALHKKLISALLKTPGLKVRNDLGFGSIDKVVIEPIRLRVLSDVRKGPARPPEEIPIIFTWTYVPDRTKTSLKLTHDGQLIRVEPEALLIHRDWEANILKEGKLSPRMGDPN